MSRWTVPDRRDAWRDARPTYVCPASFNRQALLDTEFLHSFAQRGPGDPEESGSLELVSVSFNQRLNDQLPFNRRDDLELGIAAGMLEQGSGQGGNIGPTGATRTRQRRPGGIGSSRPSPRVGDPRRHQLRGQVSEKNRVAFGHDQSAADDIFQLPHIAWPVIVLERGHHFFGDRFGFLFLVLGESFEKIVDQKPDVLASLAQWKEGA